MEDRIKRCRAEMPGRYFLPKSKPSTKTGQSMSAMSGKPNALTRFARKYCATWNEGESLCSLGGFCKLVMNQRCGYFRESVFPICDPGYEFATETRLYPVLLNRYSKIDPRVVQREAVIRICPDCNETELLPRQRVCPKCSERRRSASYRKSRKRAG